MAKSTNQITGPVYNIGTWFMRPWLKYENQESLNKEEKPMINPRIEKARAIATAAHLNQFDKGGKPRLNHVLYVGDQFSDETRKIVGYLHDTIEDSKLFTVETLRATFGNDIANAVDAISRRDGEQYFDYIARCKKNSIAREVKIEDLKHNMDRSRWPEMPDSYYKREVKALEKLGVGTFVKGGVVNEMTWPLALKPKVRQCFSQKAYDEVVTQRDAYAAGMEACEEQVARAIILLMRIDDPKVAQAVGELGKTKEMILGITEKAKGGK
jgi:hypothetical protein